LDSQDIDNRTRGRRAFTPEYPHTHLTSASRHPQPEPPSNSHQQITLLPHPPSYLQHTVDRTTRRTHTITCSQVQRPHIHRITWSIGNPVKFTLTKVTLWTAIHPPGDADNRKRPETKPTELRLPNAEKNDIGIAGLPPWWISPGEGKEERLKNMHHRIISSLQYTRIPKAAVIVVGEFPRPHPARNSTVQCLRTPLLQASIRMIKVRKNARLPFAGQRCVKESRARSGESDRSRTTTKDLACY